MTRSALRLAGAALLYGATLIGANPALAEPLDAAAVAELEAMRAGGMEKLVFHEPYAPIDETWSDQYGNRYSFADWRGEVVVANFWATWCPPCRAEMPSLDRLAGAMAGEGVAVVPISLDKADPSRVVAFLEEEIGVENLKPYIDRPGKVARKAAVLGLPVTAILDPEGREIARLVGDADWDSPEAQAILRRIVELTSPGGGVQDAAAGEDPAG